jgi:hypothetical protein
MLKTYTVVLESFNNKRAIIVKKYPEILAEDIISAKTIALQNWNKSNAKVSSVWVNYEYTI